VSFFANIIHDSRRTIRASKGRSDNLSGIEVQPHMSSSKQLDENLPSAHVFNEAVESQPDDVRFETPKATANRSFKSTNHSADFSNQSTFEKDRTDAVLKTAKVQSSFTTDPEKPLTQHLRSDSNTANNQIISNAVANSEYFTEETAKQTYIKPPTQTIKSSVALNPNQTAEQPKKVMSDDNVNGVESTFESISSNASAVVTSDSIGQPEKDADVAVTQNSVSAEAKQHEKERPEKQTSAEQQLLQKALSNMNSAFVEKQTQHTSFHPEQQNKLAQLKATPKVKIGQMNVVVETPAVKQKTTETGVSDNTSRAFLRSL
jgi:hypothetical protein